MSDSTSSEQSAGLLDQRQVAPLRFAFVGGPRDGQVIRINATKCSIGSSEQASFRLVCKGVHPIHCTILRGAAGTAIKRMSPDTLLNGTEFEEARLGEGDVLTIGPLQFRVLPQLETTSATPPAPVAAAPAPPVNNSAALSQSQTQQPQATQSTTEGSGSPAGHSSITPGPASETNTSAPVSTPAATETPRPATPPATAAPQPISPPPIAATSASDDTGASYDSCDAPQVSDATQAEANEQESDSEDAMLAQLQQRLQELEAAKTSDRNFEVPATPAPISVSNHESEDEVGSEVASALGATSSETADFKGHSTSESAADLLARLRAEQAASFTDNATSLDTSSTSESVDSPTPTADSYSTPQSADELTFSEPIDEAPIDTAAILAKFGHSLDDDEDGTKTAFLDNDLTPGSLPPSAPAPSIATPPPAPNPYGGADSTHSPSAPSASFDDDDDESIDDYMAQLMARVGGSSQSTTPPVKPEPKPEPAPASPSPDTAASVAAPEPAQERSVPLDPAEFVPRAVAPEASSNLRALRAVANTSARSAIDRHQRRSFDNKAYICWFIAIVAAIVCFSMAFFAKEIVSLPTLVSMLALLISFFATINGLAFAAKAKVGVRATQQQLLASIEHVSDQNARRAV